MTATVAHELTETEFQNLVVELAHRLGWRHRDVLGDLAEARFDAEWCVLRASDVGAAHGRARLFVLARNADEPRADARSAPGGSRGCSGESGGPPADASHLGHERRGGARGRWDGLADDGRTSPDAHSEPARRDSRAAPGPQEPDAGRSETNVGDRPANGGAASTDTAGERRTGGDESRTVVECDRLQPPFMGSRADPQDPHTSIWGPYEPAIRRWETILGREAPRPTDDRGRLSPAFVEWLMGYRAGWVTDLDLGRTASLKALGNAVVTQQAAAALRELVEVLR